MEPIHARLLIIQLQNFKKQNKREAASRLP
jgi:hypothetical protein